MYMNVASINLPTEAKLAIMITSWQLKNSQCSISSEHTYYQQHCTCTIQIATTQQSNYIIELSVICETHTHIHTTTTSKVLGEHE